MLTRNIEAPDEKQIVEAMQTWAAAFSTKTPDIIVELYAEDASLWGTLSSEQRINPALIRNYFEQIFVFPDRKVTFHDSNIRYYGDIAISSGSYTFSLTKDDDELVVPARYSFTFINRDKRWLIVEHHSSAMPASE